MCLNTPNVLVSIIRKTGPALQASVIRDLIEVLREMGIYDKDSHEVKNQIYRFPNGSAVEWFAADDEQKLRGRKRDYAWLNEANELSYEDVQQVALRTTKKIVCDFNPSQPDSWLYVLPEDKCELIHSTYHDNPFLTQEIRDQIESYRNSDPDYYTIFALGQRAFSSENVFREWLGCARPEHLHDFVYGIDFGYTHPTAMVRVWYSQTQRELWVEEVVYASGLTSTDIIEQMQIIGVEKHVPIISETARPEIIQDFKRAGYTVIPADKNVLDGILTMKSFAIQISPDAENLRKENFNYRYRKVNGAISEQPVKLWDDAIDALRYATMYIKKYCLREPGTGMKKQIWRFDI